MRHLRTSLVHPTSSPFSRNAATALAEAGFLHEVITTAAYNPSNFLPWYLKPLPSKAKQRITAELARRTWIPPQGIPLRTHPWEETLRMLLVKTNLSQSLGFGAQGPVAWVYQSLDRHVAQHHLQNLAAVYAYEDGAASTFQAAKQQGILCLYDLPIPFYKTSHRIQLEEAQKFIELAPALQAANEPSWKIERKHQEIELADHIFVASSMTQRSLLDIGILPERISVIPYGAPIEYFQPQPKSDSRFRALFVGRVGPRKGVHYLLQSWQALDLPNAELLLVGVNEFPSGWLTQYQNSFRHIPSVPHRALNQYYSSANVLVFPSLVEGFGLVLLEAMACGIPVITTPNTAGPDILTDGVEGFIIPIRDVEALQEKLEWCYCHPQELADMGKAARHKAEQLTWQLYRQHLANQVRSLLHTS
ncbi:glycosyltransferase family 4 protein [Trichocoleus desertorum AS-A10]|uniref:glycosyltransferase family 4 protein n=1 Tax=Trichocoleus desertorum TaxID=1481672 RepID=UPI003298B434